MLNNCIKNIRLPLHGKIIMFCMLLFCSAHLQAQADEDSAVVVEEINQAPPDKEGNGDDTIETKKEYFLERWENGGDSLAVQQRKLPDTLVKKMEADDDFWYANAIFEKKKKKQPEQNGSAYVPLGQRTWFQTLIWLVIIGGFAAFLIIYLSSSNVGLFRKKNKTVQASEEENITEDIFSINYQKEIDKAAMQGNHRLAVRLMYLRLLKNMAEKNIIQYKQDKTNFDYLLQLHPTAYYKDFFRLTRNYEYSWYGLFEINEEMYKIIRKDFDQFDRDIN